MTCPEIHNFLYLRSLENQLGNRNPMSKCPNKSRDTLYYKSQLDSKKCFNPTKVSQRTYVKGFVGSLKTPRALWTPVLQICNLFRNPCLLDYNNCGKIFCCHPGKKLCFDNHLAVRHFPCNPFGHTFLQPYNRYEGHPHFQSISSLGIFKDPKW